MYRYKVPIVEKEVNGQKIKDIDPNVFEKVKNVLVSVNFFPELEAEGYAIIETLDKVEGLEEI